MKPEIPTEGQHPTMSGWNRRRVLEYLLGTGIAASITSFAYTVISFVIPPRSQGAASESREAGDAEDLVPNSGIVFQFGTQPAILIRTPEGELRAFSAVCTHLGCTVQYVPESKVIWCPCHNGMFDLHGQNIGGPPPRPLAGFRVNVREGKIVVSKGA
jgi:Rieske Fe-S protein